MTKAQGRVLIFLVCLFTLGWLVHSEYNLRACPGAQGCRFDSDVIVSEEEL